MLENGFGMAGIGDQVELTASGISVVHALAVGWRDEGVFFAVNEAYGDMVVLQGIDGSHVGHSIAIAKPGGDGCCIEHEFRQMHLFHASHHDVLDVRKAAVGDGEQNAVWIL